MRRCDAVMYVKELINPVDTASEAVRAYYLLFCNVTGILSNSRRDVALYKIIRQRRRQNSLCFEQR